MAKHGYQLPDNKSISDDVIQIFGDINIGDHVLSNGWNNHSNFTELYQLMGMFNSNVSDLSFDDDIDGMDEGGSGNTSMLLRRKNTDLSGEVRIPLYTVIFLLAVVGNFLVLTTLIQNKRMRTVTNVFLVNLAITDLLLAVICMPFTLIPVLMRRFIFGSLMCVFIRYLQAISVAVNCFTLVTISIERYYAICRPLTSRRWQTLSHAYKAIALTWLGALIVAIPVAACHRLVPLRNGRMACREVWPLPVLSVIYTFFLDVVLLVMPIIVMSVAYGLIAKKLRDLTKNEEKQAEQQRNGYRSNTSEESRMIQLSARQADGNHQPQQDDGGLAKGTAGAKPGSGPGNTKSQTNTGSYLNPPVLRSTNYERNLANKQKVIKMLLVVVLEYFICWAPLFLLNSWISVDYDSARLRVSMMTKSLLHLLSYVSSCCNPITYCFMNRTFRKSFLLVFTCRCLLSRLGLWKSKRVNRQGFHHVTNRGTTTASSPHRSRAEL